RTAPRPEIDAARPIWDRSGPVAQRTDPPQIQNPDALRLSSLQRILHFVDQHHLLPEAILTVLLLLRHDDLRHTVGDRVLRAVGTLVLRDFLGHDYLISLWSVCLRSTGLYFFNCRRSCVLRRFFVVA